MKQPIQFKIGEKDFLADPLDVFVALHMARKLAPLIGSGADILVVVFKAVGPFIANKPSSQDELEKAWGSARDQIAKLFNSKVTDIVGPFLTALAALPDSDADYIVHQCLSRVRVRDPQVGWIPLMTQGTISYADVDIWIVGQIVWHVIRENIIPFIQGRAAPFPSAA